MMKFSWRALFFGMMLAAAVNMGIASPDKTNSVSRDAIEEMTTAGAPQENSPFFLEREEAQQAAAEAAKNPIYRNALLTPRHSMQQQLKAAAAALLKITKITPDKIAPTSSQLFIEPSSFSVEEISELSVSFKIINNKKEMLFLEFPTNQRIDIVIKKQDGTVITRWSEDRSFDPISSVVTINPKESISYAENISTAMMKNGTTYILEASLAGHPEYTLTKSITPQEVSEDDLNSALDE